MIYTIGKWTPETLALKNNLTEFMMGEWKNKEPQLGGILHKENHKNHPRFWEYANAIHCGQPQKNQNILDAGGLNNIMGWYLHNKIDCFVTQLGLSKVDEVNFKKNFLENIRCQSLHNQFFRINGICADICTMHYEEDFDIVYSINVIEHVRELARKSKKTKNWVFGKTPYWDKRFDSNLDFESEQEILFVKALAKAVKPGGLLIITFDFMNQTGWKCQNKCAYMRSFEDVIDRIVEPSGLQLIGEIDKKVYKNTTKMNPPASTGIIVFKK